MKPSWILFDLNGTLLDPGGVGEPLGLSREQSLAALDDAIAGSMAETLSGSYRPLPDFLRAALGARRQRQRHRGGRLPRRAGAPASRRIQDRRAHQQRPQPRRERTGGAGLIGSFDLVAGSDAVETFKPDPRIYRLGIERTGAAPEEICMVASHWWDLMGAHRTGMRGGFVQRDGRPFMAAGPEPDYRAETLDALAAQISS